LAGNAGTGRINRPILKALTILMKINRNSNNQNFCSNNFFLHGLPEAAYFLFGKQCYFASVAVRFGVVTEFFANQDRT
jgi:hypothetical protein